MKTYIIREYLKQNGTCPFRQWLDRLPVRDRAQIQARLLRFRDGNFGDWKSVGMSVKEARFMFSSGLRLYFGHDGQSLVILLCGGDKNSQQKDIQRAQKYWKDYLQRRG